MRRMGFLTMMLVGTLALAACSGGGDTDGTTGGGGAPGPTATLPAPTQSQTPGGTGGGATPAPTGRTLAPMPTASSGTWTAGPLTVTHHVAVPPVPVLLRIRSAAHPGEGYDRIVFDFTGALPGFTVRYVDQVRADPSDRPVTVPGRRFLLIVFTPAQAHTNAGVATVTPGPVRLGYPMLRGYALTGDYEGYVSVALGLDDVVGFRVGELPGTPGRIYLDVAA
jgi:hypothetical protein